MGDAPPYYRVRLCIVLDGSQHTAQRLPEITHTYIAPIINTVRQLHGEQFGVAHVAYGLGQGGPGNESDPQFRRGVTASAPFQPPQDYLFGLENDPRRYGSASVPNAEGMPMGLVEGIIGAVQLLENDVQKVLTYTRNLRPPEADRLYNPIDYMLIIASHRPDRTKPPSVGRGRLSTLNTAWPDLPHLFNRKKIFLNVITTNPLPDLEELFQQTVDVNHITHSLFPPSFDTILLSGLHAITPQQPPHHVQSPTLQPPSPSALLSPGRKRQRSTEPDSESSKAKRSRPNTPQSQPSFDAGQPSYQPMAFSNTNIDFASLLDAPGVETSSSFSDMFLPQLSDGDNFESIFQPFDFTSTQPTPSIDEAWEEFYNPRFDSSETHFQTQPSTEQQGPGPSNPPVGGQSELERPPLAIHVNDNTPSSHGKSLSPGTRQSLPQLESAMSAMSAISPNGSPGSPDAAGYPPPQSISEISGSSASDPINIDTIHHTSNHDSIPPEPMPTHLDVSSNITTPAMNGSQGQQSEEYLIGGLPPMDPHASMGALGEIFGHAAIHQRNQRINRLQKKGPLQKKVPPPLTSTASQRVQEFTGHVASKFTGSLPSTVPLTPPATATAASSSFAQPPPPAPSNPPSLHSSTPPATTPSTSTARTTQVRPGNVNRRHAPSTTSKRPTSKQQPVPADPSLPSVLASSTSGHHSPTESTSWMGKLDVVMLATGNGQEAITDSCDVITLKENSMSIRGDLWPRSPLVISPDRVAGPVDFEAMGKVISTSGVPFGALAVNESALGGDAQKIAQAKRSYEAIARVLYTSQNYARIPFQVPNGPDGTGIAIVAAKANGGIEEHKLVVAFFGQTPLPTPADIEKYNPIKPQAPAPSAPSPSDSGMNQMANLQKQAQQAHMAALPPSPYPPPPFQNPQQLHSQPVHTPPAVPHPHSQSHHQQSAPLQFGHMYQPPYQQQHAPPPSQQQQHQYQYQQPAQKQYQIPQHPASHLPPQQQQPYYPSPSPQGHYPQNSFRPPSQAAPVPYGNPPQQYPSTPNRAVSGATLYSPYGNGGGPSPGWGGSPPPVPAPAPAPARPNQNPMNPNFYEKQMTPPVNQGSPGVYTDFNDSSPRRPAQQRQLSTQSIHSMHSDGGQGLLGHGITPRGGHGEDPEGAAAVMIPKVPIWNPKLAPVGMGAVPHAEVLGQVPTTPGATSTTSLSGMGSSGYGALGGAGESVNGGGVVGSGSVGGGIVGVGSGIVSSGSGGYGPGMTLSNMNPTGTGGMVGVGVGSGIGVQQQHQHQQRQQPHQHQPPHQPHPHQQTHQHQQPHPHQHQPISRPPPHSAAQQYPSHLSQHSQPQAPYAVPQHLQSAYPAQPAQYPYVPHTQPHAQPNFTPQQQAHQYTQFPPHQSYPEP